MRTYSNPLVQAAVENMRNVIIPGFDRVTKDMQNTKDLYGRREFDKSLPVTLTQSQRDTIAKNKGVHIYGKSHPLYKGE